MKQYKNLEQRAAAQTGSSGGNEEFLRKSDIEVAINFDIHGSSERIIELINRSNQLNFTKRRVETEAEIAEFYASLGEFGAYAGAIHVRDRYADYGLVGFFMLLNRAGGNRLQHIVFSCRVMNMGVEQFTYDYLKRPAIDVVEPVQRPSNCGRDGLDSSSPRGWFPYPRVRLATAGEAQTTVLAMVGGIANAFSSDRAFLLAALLFEDVSGAAFQGALTQATSEAGRGVLTDLLADATYHAGLLRSALLAEGASDASLQILSEVRQGLDGVSPPEADATADTQDIVTSDGYVVAFTRSPAQALNVLYMSRAAAASGGFFPRGLEWRDPSGGLIAAPPDNGVPNRRSWASYHLWSCGRSGCAQ